MVSNSGLNVGSISSYASNVDSGCTTERNSHVTKGDNLWDGLYTEHTSRFNSISNKSMTLDGEVTPDNG